MKCNKYFNISQNKLFLKIGHKSLITRLINMENTYYMLEIYRTKKEGATLATNTGWQQDSQPTVLCPAVCIIHASHMYTRTQTRKLFVSSAPEASQGGATEWLCRKADHVCRAADDAIKKDTMVISRLDFAKALSMTSVTPPSSPDF